MGYVDTTKAGVHLLSWFLRITSVPIDIDLVLLCLYTTSVNETLVHLSILPLRNYKSHHGSDVHVPVFVIVPNRRGLHEVEWSSYIT